MTIQHVRILSFLLLNLQTDLHTHLAIYTLYYLLSQLLQFNHQSCCCFFFFIISVIEVGVSLPRKSSGESSSKWAVACGIILFVAITLTVGLCFHHHKKSPKHGVNNCSCKTLAMDDSPLFIKSNKNEFGV